MSQLCFHKLTEMPTPLTQNCAGGVGSCCCSMESGGGGSKTLNNYISGAQPFCPGGWNGSAWSLRVLDLAGPNPVLGASAVGPHPGAQGWGMRRPA